VQIRALLLSRITSKLVSLTCPTPICAISRVLLSHRLQTGITDVPRHSTCDLTLSSCLITSKDLSLTCRENLRATSRRPYLFASTTLTLNPIQSQTRITCITELLTCRENLSATSRHPYLFSSTTLTPNPTQR
jgi:hypothetical protein